VTKPRVLVTRLIPDESLRLIQDVCAMDLWEDELPPPHDVLLERARECDGILSLLTDRIDAAFLDHCPHLRVISNLAVGFDNIDVPAATARGVLVGNTPGVLTETTADCAFALLMAAARRIPEGIAYVRAGQWRTWGPLLLLGQDIHHATLGLIGLGRIGAEVAKRARGFAMRVLYTNRTRREDLEHQLGLEYVSLAELLSQADFVSVHTPLTSETRGLLGRDAFRQMKPTAIVVNTARGPIIDTPALVEALQAGTIGGAALDVTDPEPLPADHPLAHLPNCIVVPHIASASGQTRSAMAEIAARNLFAGLKGEQLPYGINPDALGVGRQTLPRAYDLA
jgi:glyoxylate reductase